MLNRKLQSATAGVDIGPWSLTSVYGDFPWDITTISPLVGDDSFATYVTNPTAVAFKVDGGVVFILDNGGDDVNRWTISGTGWNIAGSLSSNPSQVFSVNAQETNPTGIFFKPDGLKMYVLGSTGDDVNEYTLSTAWSLSGATYVQNFSVSAKETVPTGLYFSPDGTKMYVVGSSSDSVHKYTLSTAWNISTATFSQSFSVSAQDTAPEDVSFKPDGTKMFVLGSSDFIYEYDLSVAWDISTAVYSQSADLPDDATMQGFYFRVDGMGIYAVGSQNDSIYQYAWNGLDVSAQETAPSGLAFKPDGTKMYVIGTGGDEVNEYNLSVAWDIFSASHVQAFSVSTQDISPQAVFFKSDGTKMYVLGSTFDSVNEYSLGTAWDVSTATYTQNFSVNAQEGIPQGLAFRSDGTKMYIVGPANDAIHEYNLSTGWDISTAVFSQSFSVAAQATSPADVQFKPDGTKMFISSGVYVYEYGLSSAWDVSSASYVQSYSLPSGSATGIAFKDDGSRLYAIGQPDYIYTYILGPQP
jgi:sugar lactone lactonase YvrE